MSEEIESEIETLSEEIESEIETLPDLTPQPMLYGTLQVTHEEGDERATVDLFLFPAEQGKEGRVISLPLEDAASLWKDLNLVRELLKEGFTKLEEEVLKPEEEIFADADLGEDLDPE